MPVDRTHAEAPPAANAKQPKIPRPANSFIIFRKAMTPMLQARATSKLSQGELSRHIGQLWRSMPAAQRVEWEVKAEEAKAAHSAKHPNYVFRPKKKADKEKEKAAAKAQKLNQRRSSGLHTPAPTTTDFPEASTSSDPGASTAAVEAVSSATPSPESFFSGYGPSPALSDEPSPAVSDEQRSDSANASSDSLDQLTMPTVEFSLSMNDPTTIDWSNYGVPMLPGTAPLTPPSSQPLWSQDTALSDPMLSFGVDPSQQWMDPNFMFQDPSMLPMDPCAPMFQLDSYYNNYDAPGEINFDPAGIMGNSDVPLMVEAGSFLAGPSSGDMQDYPDELTQFLNSLPSMPYDLMSYGTDPAPLVAATNSPARTPPIEAPKYQPPAGAANSSTRRVAGSWPAKYAMGDDGVH